SPCSSENRTPSMVSEALRAGRQRATWSGSTAMAQKWGLSCPNPKTGRSKRLVIFRDPRWQAARAWSTLTAARRRCRAGAIERLDRRQVAGEAFDLDRRELSGATLSEPGRPDVAGEHVRVAMHAEGHLLLWIHGVIPGAGRQLNDPAPDPVREADARQAGAARVENANDVSIRDAARGSVVGVHARNLAPAMLGLGAVPSEVQLAMKARGGLIGDKHERRLRRRDIRRRKPGGMAGTIRLSEACDGR